MACWCVVTLIYCNGMEIYVLHQKVHCYILVCLKRNFPDPDMLWTSDPRKVVFNQHGMLCGAVKCVELKEEETLIKGSAGLQSLTIHSPPTAGQMHANERGNQGEG